MATPLYPSLNIHIDITLGYELINEIGSMPWWNFMGDIQEKSALGNDSVIQYAGTHSSEPGLRQPWCQGPLWEGLAFNRALTNWSLNLPWSLTVQQLFYSFRDLNFNHLAKIQFGWSINPEFPSNFTWVKHYIFSVLFAP